MLGLVVYRADGEPEPPFRTLAGARFQAVYILRGTSARARLVARIAAGRLARRGVRQAVFPPDFACMESFARRGVLPVPTAPFYRATAAAIVRRYLAQRGLKPRDVPLAFSASRVTPELRRAVEELCGEVRRPALSAEGGEALAQDLLRRRGVALRLLPPGESAREGLTVAFDASPAAGEVLRLDETLQVEYDAPFPTPLLAALWSVGALDSVNLSVKSINCDKKMRAIP